MKAPPFDPALEAARKTFPVIAQLDEALVLEVQKATSPFFTQSTAETAFGQDPEIEHEEITVPGHDGCEVKLAVVRRRRRGSTSDGGSERTPGSAKGDLKAKPRPAIYFMHGGGLCFGNRFVCTEQIPWVKDLDVVLVSVEYRLVPEHPYPIPLEDCYSGLRYVVENAAGLGIDKERIVVAGISAGGGLAAGLGLLGRDRGGLGIRGMCLMCPMLDDRNESESCKQFYKSGTWNGAHNRVAWDWYFNRKKSGVSDGHGEGDGEVSFYASPGRATDLSDLPSTWIDVGEADLFRDEDVKFASRIWEAGGSCELHVWKGAWHAFEVFGKGSLVANACDEARLNWLRRILA
ncbi:hypothetical protein VTL71DRAFT_13612 [Oculimacula yallundae]|uniref:Alpha/beta hydrolase fold-3 domain-containing protein n=1 Tax=Oculimacula yallundae TaxID=86028 RepID=A0ABR4CKU9_9HELO